MLPNNINNIKLNNINYKGRKTRVIYLANLHINYNKTCTLIIAQHVLTLKTYIDYNAPL